MNTITRTAEIAEAREADTRIAQAWDEFWKVQDKVNALSKTLRSFRTLRGGHWERRTQELTVEVEELTAQANALSNAAKELDRELYTGWTRFFLVKHIHNSQHCSSFRWNTRIAWLPSVSGLTEVEAVSEYGETLCTKCFASAPVEGSR